MDYPKPTISNVKCCSGKDGTSKNYQIITQINPKVNAQSSLFSLTPVVPSADVNVITSTGSYIVVGNIIQIIGQATVTRTPDALVTIILQPNLTNGLRFSSGINGPLTEFGSTSQGVGYATINGSNIQLVWKSGADDGTNVLSFSMSGTVINTCS